MGELSNLSCRVEVLPPAQIRNIYVHHTQEAFSLCCMLTRGCKESEWKKVSIIRSRVCLANQAVLFPRNDTSFCLCSSGLSIIRQSQKKKGSSLKQSWSRGLSLDAWEASTAWICRLASHSCASSSRGRCLHLCCWKTRLFYMCHFYIQISSDSCRSENLGVPALQTHNWVLYAV